MMESWATQIIEFLPEGIVYLGVIFAVAFLESLPIAGLLMPGSTLIVFAGFLAFHGKSGMLLLFFSASAGAFLGDTVSYLLGYHFGPLLLRLRYFQRRHKMIRASEQFFVDHGGKSLFFARFLGPIRGITPCIAGLSGMKFKPFFGYTVLSTVLWGLSYPGLGYLGSHSWQQAQSMSARFGLVIIALLALVIVHHWVRKNLKN